MLRDAPDADEVRRRLIQERICVACHLPADDCEPVYDLVFDPYMPHLASRVTSEIYAMLANDHERVAGKDRTPDEVLARLRELIEHEDLVMDNDFVYARYPFATDVPWAYWRDVSVFVRSGWIPFMDIQAGWCTQMKMHFTPYEWVDTETINETSLYVERKMNGRRVFAHNPNHPLIRGSKLSYKKPELDRIPEKYRDRPEAEIERRFRDTWVHKKVAKKPWPPLPERLDRIPTTMRGMAEVITGYKCKSCVSKEKRAATKRRREAAKMAKLAQAISDFKPSESA